MDRLNGRISYLGEVHLFNQQNKKPLIAFIELNSKNYSGGEGLSPITDGPAGLPEKPE